MYSTYPVNIKVRLNNFHENTRTKNKNIDSLGSHDMRKVLVGELKAESSPDKHYSS